MIRELMKLDVGWRYVKRQTMLFVAVAAIWHLLVWHVFSRTIGDDDGAMWTLLLMVFAPLFSVGFTPVVRPLDTPFQATLPVTVREVFMVRIVSALALQWLPALAGCIMLVLLGDQPASGVTVQTWWAFTCIVLCGQCAGIRELTIWGVLRLIALPVVVFVMNLIAFALDWPFRDSVAWNLALIGCWLFTAALVARTWQTIPKVFDIAPADAFAGDTTSIPPDSVRTHRAPWRPVLGTLFPFWGFEYLVTFAVMCYLHSPIIVLGVSGQGWTSMRTATRWMLPLPVRRQALLTAVVLPGVLSVSCGYLVGLHLHNSYFSALRADKGLRSQIVTVVLIAAWSMLANLCALAGDWRIVRRILPPWNWPAIFASPIVGLALLVGVFKLARGFEPVRWLSDALPSSLAGAVAVSLALLGVLWWALDAMFRQVELVDKPARGAA